MVGILMFHIVLHVFFVAFYISAANGVGSCTTSNGLSLSAWDWEVGNKNGETYHINLCKKPEKCSKDVSICKKVKKTEINYGAIKAPLPATNDHNNSSFSVSFLGEDMNSCDNGKYQSQIFFYCDKVLGFPELVEETNKKCSVIFYFYTNEACHNMKPTAKEIPCLVWKDGVKRDLSPLIKQEGGHLVSSSEHGVDIYINVCREITSNAKVPVNACPRGSSSCRIDKKVSIGQITNTSQLKYDVDNKIILTYTAPKITTGCKKVATTNITFICPTNFKDGGMGPVLISSSSSCQYEIEWKTDYACPDKSFLTSNCTYTDGNVTFDLAKLEKPIKEESYGVKAGKYVYRIKVCHNGQKCGNTDAAVCQINTAETVPDTSCGDANYRHIRYADKKLTLIYKNGKQCRSGINRTTIINFRCDPTIEIGAPTFVEEQHCHYFFDWTTRHVCVSRKPGTCSVTALVKKRVLTFDLSVLTRTGNLYWTALNIKGATDYTYYINVCGEVHSKQFKGCSGSAVCEIHLGKGRGIGKYSSAPQYVSSSGGLQLNYTGGKCDESGRKITTIIKFNCKNKNMESPPELESKSWDGCQYLFTWSTAAACSLHVESGKDCVLEDSVTGNVFDLSKLREGPNGDSKPNYFNVLSGNQNFKIKVCGSLLKADCGGKEGIGVCQTSGSKVFSAGKGNSKLYYYDGKMNLTYSNGDKCNVNGKPSRLSHITFFCDEKAGVGKPIFEKETYCSYHFLWYTSYACPSKTLECLAKDSKGEYDLSSLVKTDSNWVTNGGSGLIFYINLCRVLHRNEDTKDCPVASAVCMKNKTGSYNIGEVSGPLTFQNYGSTSNLALNYRTRKCQTIIYLMCLKNGAESGPSFLNHSQVAECKFIFLWETPAACAVKAKTAAAGCSGIISVNENYVGINVLAKPTNKFYAVDGTSFKIRFNICKNITCDSTSTSTACMIQGKKEQSIGRMTDSTIEFRRDMIVLSYPGGYYMHGKSWGLHAKTVINFICTQNVTEGTPVFRSLETNVYTIDFPTSVACPASDVQCAVSNTTSGGKEYDLSPLGLKIGNWMAADTRAHLDYYINICQAYNPSGETSLSCSGNVGGCQVDRHKNETHNMGYVTSSPQLSTSQDVILRYIGGEICHKKFRRSTRINFFCSTVHGSPVYMTETEDCEYVFNWKTPSACPLKTYSGRNCQVYDSYYGVLYDLRNLKQYRRSVNLGDGTMLYVGFCGTMLTQCQHSAACLKNATHIIKSFSSATTITYTKEMISMKQSNDSCDITNKFYCGDEKLSEGKIIQNATPRGCKIVLAWRSSMACRPVRGEECSLTDNKGVLYDLSVLAKESWNWKAVVTLTEYNISQFYLSVCKPLIIDEQLNGAQQGSRAAIVISKTVFSLGTMTEKLSIKNGFLTMIYSGGSSKLSLCRDGKLSAVHIQFVCDTVPEGQGGVPVLDAFDISNCIFHVTWVTKAACGVRSLAANSRSKRNCTAIHPATMKSIDLQKLHNKNGYTLKNNYGTVYKLTVCGLPGVTDWPRSAGMCKLSNNKYQSVGTLNQTLVYRQGFLYLLYKHGAKCSDGSGRKMETLISFICDRKVTGKGIPKLEERTKDECTHYLSWRTPLVCEAEVECMVSQRNQLYDLSPLIKNNGNYEVLYKGTTYLINVCRSLVNDHRCSSHSEAAVCSITTQKNGEHVSFDHGHISSPKFIADQVTLKYSNGSCGNNKVASSTIVFVCNKLEVLGKPTIMTASDDGCSTRFIWETSLVCKTQPVVQSNECKYYHHDMGFCFNFTKLGIHTIKATPTETFIIGICNSSKEFKKNCKNSEICLNSKSLGDKRKIQYMGRQVEITYDRAVIIMYCGNDNSHGPQYIGKKKDDKYVFNWITPLVCPPRRLSCIIDAGGKMYDLSVLTQYNNSYLVKHGGDSYRINICGNIPFTQTGICSSRITAWRNTSAGDIQVIGDDTEQKLYFVDHDHDFPIRLIYSSDTVIKDCKLATPSVIHKFGCSDVNHPPHFDSFDAKKCVFVFIWRTHAACAEKSCSNARASFGKKAAVAVIATFTAVGAIAALLFFACKPEKRQTAALWIRWHVRKYICCKPSYQASYRYKKVNTGEVDSETDFIVEANVGTVFSDDDDDDYDDDDDDDDLLPLDDDLLNLDEE